jgi:2-iminoacetate synthase
MALMSPAASGLLEEMAQEASRVTARQFGRTISLFTPLYLSNFCTNHCVYCGFNCRNQIHRSMLTLDQVDAEGQAIAATGLKHLLILTGDAPAKAGVDYLEACTRVLARYFPSVSVEVFALTEEEYARLNRAGVDGLTMFQETYDEALYATLHPKGPKRDFRFRLDAPERGCRAGLRTVNIGALLGLGDWRRDALLTGLHAAYLVHRYPQTEIAVSLPRMRPHAGGWQPATIADDRDMVQFMTALRLFLPRVGITISTREDARFRENILPLGVTRMSAGVSTAVGGHSDEGSDDENTGQFEISDGRSVDEMCAALRARGYQPVFKDWEPILEPAKEAV